METWWVAYGLKNFEKKFVYEIVWSEKRESYDLASIFEIYRIRITDKLLALCPFLLLTVELFGEPCYRTWDPRFFEFMGNYLK